MKYPEKIVLASASPRRKELLLRAGLQPEIVPSLREERCRAKTPAGVVKALSRLKAEEVAASQAKGTVVIGADTVVALDGEILGKPRDREDAFRMLLRLSGRAHRVYTGVTILVCGGERLSFCEKTEVSLYPLAEEEIESYIETGEPFDKAGAYGIQGAFGAYIRGLRGDYTNVVGLPLGRTIWELKKLLKREGERRI